MKESHSSVTYRTQNGCWLPGRATGTRRVSSRLSILTLEGDGELDESDEIVLKVKRKEGSRARSSVSRRNQMSPPSSLMETMAAREALWNDGGVLSHVDATDTPRIDEAAVVLIRWHGVWSFANRSLHGNGKIICLTVVAIVGTEVIKVPIARHRSCTRVTMQRWCDGGVMTITTNRRRRGSRVNLCLLMDGNGLLPPRFARHRGG